MTDRSDGRSAAFCHSPRSHDRAVAPAVFVFLLAPSSAARPAPNAAPTRGQQFPIRRHWRYAVSGQHDIKRRSFARSSAACSPRRILMDQLHELCAVLATKGQIAMPKRAVVLGFCAGVFLLAAVVETSLAAPTASPSDAPCPLCPQHLSPASSVRAPRRAGHQH